MIPNSKERTQIIKAFQALRKVRPGIGISELLVALEGPPDHWSDQSDRSLLTFLEMVWCANPMDRNALETIWVDQAIEDAKDNESKNPLSAEPNLPKSEQPEQPDSALQSDSPTVDQQTNNSFNDESNVKNLAGVSTDDLAHDPTELVATGPVTRRGLIHCLRKVRQMRRGGHSVKLDVEATIDQTCKQGFYLGPVLKSPQANTAQVLFLIDQEGSMVPFHRLTRDLVAASTDSGLYEIGIYYFHNSFENELFQNENLQDPISIGKVIQKCATGTRVFVISDAGAARGGIEIQRRIVPTLRFLNKLQNESFPVVWLNPMPKRRWLNTSADYISQVIPMFTMTQDGVAAAIAALYGRRTKGVA